MIAVIFVVSIFGLPFLKKPHNLLWVSCKERRAKHDIADDAKRIPSSSPFILLPTRIPHRRLM